MTGSERAATAEALAAVQHESGFVPRSPGSIGDPWNHVECAMALAGAGRLVEADRAYRWCVETQADDGSWPAELGPDGKGATARVDTNCVAYLAVGVLHRYHVTADLSAARELFPAVDRALALVVGCQRAGGEVPWEIDAEGQLGRYALLSASSSIYQSLCAGVALAALLGLERPAWLGASAGLRLAIGAFLSGARSGFEPKDEFAMDWYYPVLAGVLDGEAATARLSAGRAGFVVEGLGVRCRSDGRWVTTAESAECALAHGRAGERTEAATLLAWTRHQRQADGGYLTGLVHPERSEFPPSERTSYSAAAVLLAEDALAGGPAATTFDWPPPGRCCGSPAPAGRAS